MTSQFSPNVSQILAFSREEATRLASTTVGPEHLLLGILREKEGAVIDMLNGLNVDITRIKEELEQRIRTNTSAITNNNTANEILLNEQASNILRLAVLEARIQHTSIVDTQHVLLAILHDQIDNGAKVVLEANHVDYEQVAKLLQKKPTTDGIGFPDEEEEDFEEGDNAKAGRVQSTQTDVAQQGNGKTPVLDNFSTDLTRAAAEGKLDPVVGREKEIQRVTEILCRRKKNNPILIGEPGVGKSAIVEGLAQMIVSHHTSPVLFNRRLVSLDMTGIVAGTKYRGQFEERIRALIKELEQNPNIIVFIDEIHTIIGAGSSPGTMDAANIMKPALARGTIQCIGATTLDEFRKTIEKDGALERRFQKVLVEPTTADQTLQILHNIKGCYEEHHHVTYTEEALEACVKLTGRYITDREFPDKAIDALDEVGAHIRLQHAQVPPEITEKEKEITEVKGKKEQAVKSQNYELATVYRDRQTHLEQELHDLQLSWQNGDAESRQKVTEKDVAGIVSRMSGVPVQRMEKGENMRLRDMGNELKKRVIGQDKAIEKLVKAIQRNRVGLRDPNHPIGAFMLLGPTGVGKTYLAKCLAENMFGSKDSIIRIDMSEYTESFNVSRLIGAPPGYVGYDEGGQLTEQVRRHPYSIVLLDEIEKAHGNVFNLMLQVLDEGRLTDGNGRTVDFRNTVIIMTSNAGTRQLKEFSHGVGFNAAGISDMGNLSDKDKEYARSVIQKSLSKQFSPEFLNRLDEIITFDQLDLHSIKKIIDIELAGLYKRIEDKGLQIHLTDAAKEFVASKGYDIQFGARPLKRAIQTYIEDGLCELILSGDVKKGDSISVDKKTESTELSFEKMSM